MICNARMSLCLMTFLIVVFTPLSGWAGCDPKSDPCAVVKAKDQWSKDLALGLNYSSGNSDTTVVSVLGQANRETDQDLIDLSASYSYGEDRAKADLPDGKKKQG